MYQQPTALRAAPPVGRPAEPTNNETHASRAIENGITHALLAGQPVDEPIARVIAAAVHPGRGSQLERFATCGEHPRNCGDELQPEAANLSRRHTRWLRALDDYLQSTNPQRDCRG
jgi:hypothetical protein